MRKIFFLLSFIAQCVYAQVDLNSFVLKSAGINMSSVNPAYFNKEIRLSNTNHRIMMNSNGLYFARNMLSKNIGVVVEHFAVTEYSRQIFSFHVSDTIFRNFTLGLRMKMKNENLPESGSSQYLNEEIGMIWKCTPNMSWGTIFEINNTFLNRFLVKSSLSYLIHEKVLISTGVKLQNSGTSEVEFGTVLKLHPNLDVVLGFELNQLAISFGTNFNLNKYTFSLGFSAQKYFGTSSFLCVAYKFD